MHVEVRLFDVYQRRQLDRAGAIDGSANDVRRMAHQFADEIMTQFTGERGPFDSRIAFVSTRDGRFKEIYVMSLDGGDLQPVTNEQTINLSPAWMPDGRSVLLHVVQAPQPGPLLDRPRLSGRETRLSSGAA